ncbi:MAG: metallophosphoesterase [Deltaproteobacteria bacterium]|jgi:cytochrome c biogenesis protein CcdA|nr:metallophosphoesterase [Deltaproteobacteria bacterium]MBW2534620.1 metallophosphoesterase [Deltaproteobacteria bacterium]
MVERSTEMGGRASRRALLCLAVAIGLLCWVVPTRAQDAGRSHGFRIAPYVVDAARTSATVAFVLERPGPAAVWLGQAGAQREIPSPSAKDLHFVKVAGLEPGRTFAYRVSCPDEACATPEGDGSYQLRTASLPGESFTFTVYGDPRPGDNQTHRHHELVVEQMLRVEPAFSLVLGDLVDDGSEPEAWARFFSIEAELRRRAAIFPVLGDNDVAAGRGLAPRYFPRLKEGPYSFEWGGIRFFGMQAWGTRGLQPEEELDGDSPQIRWLTSELVRDEVRNAPFRILFLHDPVRISRGRAADLLQRVWAPLLSRHGVDLVFASWHLYERSRHETVTYVISGGAGAELVWFDPDPSYPALAEAKRHHFCRVDVKAGALELRAIAEDGTVLDAITLLPRTGAQAPSSFATQRLADRLRQRLVLGPDGGGPELPLLLFSYDCRYCRRLLDRDLPRWADEAGVRLRVDYYDLGQPGAYDLLMAAGADFGRQDAPLPTLFVGRVVLGGEGEISSQLGAELERFRRQPERYRQQAVALFESAHDTSRMRSERFEALNLGVVLTAGLLDGLNPCAFTTIIFLLSYLSLAGGSRRQILRTGALFTLAVFLTYLAIGVLFYQLASVLMEHRELAWAVNLLLLGGLVVLALLSGRDAVRALRGRPTEISLKLPNFLQRRIRSRIRRFAKSDRAMGSAALSLGVIVAGMELACTGQVYVPIVTMIAEPRYRAAASLHLLAYNLAFIVPLCVVFALAAFGMTSQRLARLARRHVATAKIALTLLFVALALVVLYNLGWLP